MTRLTFAAAALLLSVLPAAAQQAAPAAPVAPLEVKLIRDNVYWSPGNNGNGSSNSGIIVGKDGITVIDAKNSAATAKDMLAAIARISPLPVKQVILTDRGGHGLAGIVGFPEKIDIISNAMMQGQIKANVGKPGGVPIERVPNKTFNKDRVAMTLNGVRFVLLHIAPSHHDSESSVYLPDQRIVFTGLVLQSSPDFPIIHTDTGGSAVGWVKFMKALVQLDADTYVLGSGDIWTKAQMEQRLGAQVATLTKIRDMVAAGKTREDVRQAFDSYKVMGGRGPQIYFFSEAAYDETVKGLNK